MRLEDGTTKALPSVSTFQMELTLLEADRQLEDLQYYQVLVDNWRRSELISLRDWNISSKQGRFASAETGSTTAALPSTNSYVFVSAPIPPRTSVEEAVLLLTQSVSYHLALGFSCYVQYVRLDAYLYGLMTHPGVQGLVADGCLQLRLWDLGTGTPHPSGGCQDCDMALVYQHALLSYFGQGAYLALADVNAYVASPRDGQHIEQMVEECLGAPSLACLPSRYIYEGEKQNDTARGSPGQKLHPLCRYTWVLQTFLSWGLGALPELTLCTGLRPMKGMWHEDRSPPSPLPDNVGMSCTPSDGQQQQNTQ